MLPPFSSEAGETARAAIETYADLLALIDRSEAEGADAWLHWADREAARRYPKDMELVARWMLHETIRGETRVVQTLHTVLSSLPVDEARKPAILDPMARADFLLGRLAAGQAKLRALVETAPDHDCSFVEAAEMRALVAAGAADAATQSAQARLGCRNDDLAQAVAEVFQAASAHHDLCRHIETKGGLTVVTSEALAGVLSGSA